MKITEKAQIGDIIKVIASGEKLKIEKIKGDILICLKIEFKEKPNIKNGFNRVIINKNRVKF